MSLDRKMESEYLRTFYNLTTVNLQQAPVLLSELILLWAKQPEVRKKTVRVCVCVCADLTAPAGVCQSQE